MTALTKDRNTPRRVGEVFSCKVAEATKIFAGSLVCLNSAGYAVPGSTATTLTPIGRAEETVDNSSGSDGDLSVSVLRGVFRWGNSASSDLIAITEIGKVVYIVDDQTVAKTNGTNTRSRAGFVVDVDSDGVWLLTGYGMLSDPSGALLAANDLSDLDTPATARTNLGGGADKIVLSVPDLDLVGANAEVKQIVAPVAGNISKIYSVINGALETGNATLTAAIGATPVTSGVITITQADSAAGDVDSATPSAANTVAVGDVISITVGGTNDASKLAQVSLVITPSA